MEDDPRFRAVQSMLLRWGYTPAKAVNSQTIQLLAAADAVDPLRQPAKPAEDVPAVVFTPEMEELVYQIADQVIGLQPDRTLERELLQFVQKAFCHAPSIPGEISDV